MTRPSLNFVVFGNKWADVLRGQCIPIEEIASRITSNEDIWSVLTYLQLSARGLVASISNMPVRDRINIVDGIRIDESVLEGHPEIVSPEVFLVGCRGDGHYPGACQMVIRQNLLVSRDEAAIYIPQWAQPGLIPRNQSRSAIRTVGFLGDPGINLAKCFREPCFEHELYRRGYRLLIRGKSAQQVRWHDYSDVDVILAVRDIPAEHLKLKPVNKLTNAWLAGVPAMIGAEPAIQAIRQSPLDCLEVAEPGDVFHALGRLERCPALYRDMVDHGRRRGAEYADEAIATRWMQAIEAMQNTFRAWQALSAADRRADCLRRIELGHLHLKRHLEAVHAAYAQQGYGPRWWEAL